MIIDLNWTVALLGCAALVLFWLWQRTSGVRGLLFVLLGNIIIIGAVLYTQNASRFSSVVGMLLAFLVIASLVLCLVMLSLKRRHQAPRYQAPNEMNGRCSECAKLAQLKHYKQGWLCAMCARRRDAKAA